MSGAGQVIQADKSKPRKDCRSWILRRSFGRDTRTGRYITKSRRFHGTYREAQEALREWNGETQRRHRAPLFEDFAAEWLARRPVAESTRKKCSYHIKAAAPYLAGLPLDAITAADVRRALESIDASGTYRNGVYMTLNALFKDAVTLREIESTPLEGVNPPKVSTKEKQALKTDSIASLVDALRPLDAHRVAVALALLAGLRRGEIGNALEWSHVDFAAGLLHVPGTKSRSAAAPVPMGDTLAGILAEWREQQTPASAYVVPMTPAAVGRWWNEGGAESFGVPGVTFHQLRHTYVSMLARAGVHPATMQRLARHADARTTLRIYTHVQMEQEREAVDAMERLI